MHKRVGLDFSRSEASDVHALAAAVRHHRLLAAASDLRCCRPVRSLVHLLVSKGKTVLLSFMVPSIKEHGTTPRGHLRKISP